MNGVVAAAMTTKSVVFERVCVFVSLVGLGGERCIACIDWQVVVVDDFMDGTRSTPRLFEVVYTLERREEDAREGRGDARDRR